jgi:murein DD-endopeptidase MepM/ murein hydrolase activator NlpD
LDALRLLIEEKTQEIERHKVILAELIRTIHREEQRDILELLLSNESFSEFFSQVEYLQGVYIDVGLQTGSLRDARTVLNGQEDDLEEKQDSLEDLHMALAAKEEELTESRVYKEQLLVETKSSEAIFTDMLSNLRAEYQSIENEIQATEREIRLKLEGHDQLNFDGETVLSWPVPSRYVTAYFHDPDYPFRHVFEHAGIDIRAGQGTEIRAAAPGFVARAKNCSNSWCYSYVMLIHGDGLSTVYGHMSSVGVEEDQFVGRGDVIGYTGGTPGTAGAGPFVTGPHLHFESRLNGIPVNPLNYLL